VGDDDLEPIWLVPGVLPEPYWDFTMGLNYSYPMIKKLMGQATKVQLSQEHQNILLSALSHDPEIVFHLGLTPQMLPDLVLSNQPIAYEVLISMTNSVQITSYYDALSNMNMNLNALEVFSKLTSHVELPKEFIQVYLKNCMQ